MMNDVVVGSSPLPLPSIAAYNIRFLSLSPNQKDQWQRKLSNVKHLAKQYNMVALLETHVAGDKADLFFCKHVDGVERFYQQGMAVLVQKEWAEVYKPEMHVVVPDAMVAMVWEHNGINHFVFFLRLDAFAESARREQLRAATAWARGRVRATDWVAFAGDRNFVQFEAERQSGSDREWRQSERMNAAWSDWLRSIGCAYELAQPEFTWGRIVSSHGGRASWTFEILDVVGTNQHCIGAGDLQPFSRRGDDVPHPRASDHWPVGLQWHRPRVRKSRPQAPRFMKRAIPRWLLEEGDFLLSLDEWFHEWCRDRPQGMAGLQSFAIGAHECASSFMSSRIVRAKTVAHKLEVALSAKCVLEQCPVDDRRLARLCAIDPNLEDIVEIQVDLDRPGQYCVPAGVLEKLSEHFGELANAAILEASNSAELASEDSHGLRGHQTCQSTVQTLKKLKEGKRIACAELWDDEHECFTAERARMAELIRAKTLERQGAPRGYPLAGQLLLDEWQANFSDCRTALPRHEVESIILDSPNGKQPGPDGVPGAILKRYARQLAYIFQEAWEELSEDSSPQSVLDCLGLKKWLVIPKFEGANTISKLRDLELGNEVRKVLARMLFRAFDEVCQHSSQGLSHAQQAFVKGRDFVRNTSMLSRTFWSAVEETTAGDDPFLLLSLDCSKGYNSMDHE